MGTDAIEEMTRRGLKVVEMDAAALDRWQSEAEKAYPKAARPIRSRRVVRPGAEVAGRVPQLPPFPDRPELAPE